MKYQMTYKSNLDYENTYTALKKSPLTKVKISEGGIRHQGCGLLQVWVKDLKNTTGKRADVIIGTKGKVQFAFSNEKEKEIIITLLRPHLRTEDNRLAYLKPRKTQVALDWPPPSGFKFSACPQEFHYVLRSIRKVDFRRGVHPFLWVLCFMVLSFPVWLQILLRFLS